MGMAVRHGGGYAPLNGNKVGMLLLDFLCSAVEERGRDFAGRIAVTTVVSAP